MPSIVKHLGELFVILRQIDDFGLPAYDLVGYPRRCIDSEDRHPLYVPSVDVRHITQAATPSQLLQLAKEEAWITRTAKALGRIQAAFLLAEDPQRRLDAQKAAALMHQMSLVQHVLTNQNLRRVLIADEVGLGKTIEAGMIVKRVLAENSNARVLYLAPARLVRNVVLEFSDKLAIDARRWVAGDDLDARLESDKVVAASLNRAVYMDNLDKVVASGPWDVIIVDECHHLSDWDPGGGSPNRSFRLVEQLAAKLPKEGRLILLSGTPHQGSIVRFENILRLLTDDHGDYREAAGRVIYRTKERVSDWSGRPLFPRRNVRETTVVSLGPEFHQWYQMIAALYERRGLSGSAARAAGWAKSQALQWASSSVEAGIGFLGRLAIRRLNWTLDQTALKEALAALRPYRGGSADEPLRDLYARVVKQIGPERLFNDLEDTEEIDDDETWRPDPKALTDVLRFGVALLRSPVGTAKWGALNPLLNDAKGEKVVLFAQPVETVNVVVRHLEHLSGERPALIVGNQSDEERLKEIRRFRKHDGPQFLVSSRAGGEGLNMQVARRLIHLDVPWNPMELEQRIGRIHRFGSKQTIIVDTLVVQGTREVDIYRIAREKLRIIASHLDPEQFEILFSRVMSLVPPKELETVMGQGPSTKLDAFASDGIGELVRNGFATWEAFDKSYRDKAKQIASVDAGQASWSDVADFLIRNCGAKPATDVKLTAFEWLGDEVVATEQFTPAMTLDDELCVCADTQGVPAETVDGSIVPTAGLNHAIVRSRIKSLLSAPDVGGGYIHRPVDLDVAFPKQFGLLCFLRHGIRMGATGVTESSLALAVYVVDESLEAEQLESERAAQLLRALFPAPRIKDPIAPPWVSGLPALEADLAASLRKPSDGERNDGVRAAVWPIGALIIGT